MSERRKVGGRSAGRLRGLRRERYTSQRQSSDASASKIAHTEQLAALDQFELDLGQDAVLERLLTLCELAQDPTVDPSLVGRKRLESLLDVDDVNLEPAQSRRQRLV